MFKNRNLKNFLIYPKFQLTLVIINLIIISAAFVLVFQQVISSFDDLLLIGQKLKLDPNSAFFRFLGHQKGLLLNRLYLAAGVSYSFTFVLTIYFSHKATGPIYRLKTYFLEMKSKEKMSPLTFRKGDYYDDLPEIINDGLETIKQKN